MGQRPVPMMTPAPGERLQRFVGDRVRFVLKNSGGTLKGWSARLRTNLGRADVLRREIIQAHAQGVPPAGNAWRDLPMEREGDQWSLELPLPEAGYFKAKAYLRDPSGWQHWPDGPDVGLSVHPDAYRTANTIYCAFPRLFGPTRSAINAQNERLESQIKQIEHHGYSILPPSGKLRDLIQHLPHIIDTLGCRVLHLLPVNPTPTTYARFGRFGSPYAALDLTLIDPALVVFDRRTTGIDQFRELTYATHSHGGRVLLDIIINHTGWGSILQENHPEWFLRNPDGTFASPGAWGVVWEDLVELKHDNVALWDQLAEMLLVWCHRGVDGFRCDAGYKVPVSAWQYIIARVQQEFPEALFLLEGLGGAWETTEALLTEGGMQWAYSELFQNYSGVQVADYLDYALRQNQRVGLYVHYSETHDNDRLAKRGRAWSLLRNRLCGLASMSGGFGFTCGVEWLATEKIDVHTSTGLAWGNHENILPELAALNRLLVTHPCFFDGTRVTRLSAPDSPVYALLRESAEGKDAALVLVNTNVEREQPVKLPAAKTRNATGSIALPDFSFELLGQSAPALKAAKSGEVTLTLPPGAVYCLSPTNQPLGLSGDDYRRMRARAAWAIQAITENLSVAETGPCDWQFLSQAVDRSSFAFLAAVQRLDPSAARSNLQSALEKATEGVALSKVIRWQRLDHRITPVPPGHWLLIEDTAPFRASLELPDGSPSLHVHSIVTANGHIACFPPRTTPADAKLQLERYTAEDQHVEAIIRFLAPLPQIPNSEFRIPNSQDVILLTNGIGGMARVLVDLGRVKSKYDCVLAANLHPGVPVDRHVFVKRLRAWVNADGFISRLDINNLVSLKPGPPAAWDFVANAGDGRTVEIQIQAEMPEGRNTTVFHFRRSTASQAAGTPLPPTAEVRVTVRVDIEDRNFHWETRRNGGAEYHFSTNTKTLDGQPGFAFTPAADRRLRVFASAGQYHPQPEWSENIPHPIEQGRGQTGSGDAYSPGWFDLPLSRNANVTLMLTADPADPKDREAGDLKLVEENHNDFEGQLVKAARAFVVRRDTGKTVIAGYPWFLDWGRDTFICARGLLAAGLVDEVKQILVTFARFEKNGTLPNTIYGNDASNRDTSDAPLWFAVVCEEIADCGLRIADFGTEGGAHRDDGFYDTRVDESGRTIRDVLKSVAINYSRGTPNGIRMDRDSALVWSPAHFTWMDTNYPAATAREGYPIEIQALWIRLLRQLGRIDEVSARKDWSELADAAMASMEKRFWLEERGYYADLLIATSGQSAAQGAASDALRSNCIFPISLGLVKGERARRCIEAAARHLVVPGALRSLAPLPVTVPLPVYGNDGRLLNDPNNPYWGRYEGDEDTRRKAAYHNGTAWTWTFPVFCEALAMAWDHSPDAVATARAYLGSIDRLLAEGCLNQLPEILDGDAPHTQRGCDAQAWGMTEALRVWRLLEGLRPHQ